MTDAFWRTKDPMVFEIAGKRFNLMTKGADYAAQFGNLTGWIGTHGISGLLAAYDAGVTKGTSDTQVAVGLVSYLLQYGISPTAMIDLGAILLNTDREFVEENFDPGWVVDALLTLLDNKPGIKFAFVRVWERFFLSNRDDAAIQEDEAQDTE